VCRRESWYRSAPDPIRYEVAGVCTRETAKANEEVVHAACL
jgi:hypothetical protein